jgi:hypothetical protein
MKLEMSKRERILILIALALLITFVSVRFIIMPLRDGYTAMLEEYEALTMEKQLLDLKLMNEETTRMGYENARSSFEDMKNRYPPFMSNADIDRELTGMCVRNRLNPISLSIIERTGLSTSAEDESYPVYVVTASMTMNGGYDSINNLISAAEATEHIRITRLSFSFDIDMNAAGRPNAALLFEVTMLGELED